MSTTNSNDVVISKDSDSVPDPTCKSFEIDEEDPSKTTTEEDADTRTKGFVVIVAAAAALGGMIFGYGKCRRWDSHYVHLRRTL